MSGYGDSGQGGQQYGDQQHAVQPPTGEQQPQGYPAADRSYGQQPGYDQPPTYGDQTYGQQPQPVAQPSYPAQGYGMSPNVGALGRPRSIGICILLAVVTLGIYTFVWTYKTHKELREHTGDGLGGGLGLLLYFLAGIATYFLIPSEIEKMLSRSGQRSRVSTATGFWYFLPFVGTIVWFVKVQGQLNDYWRSLGATG